jgi:sulfotransferase family protein
MSGQEGGAPPPPPPQTDGFLEKADPSERRDQLGPDFIGIGTQRSGSSWLHQVLSAHPGLWLPPIKELHYFDDPLRERYYRFLRMRLVSGFWINHPFSRWDLRYFLRTPNDPWYCSLFEPGRRRGLLTGEITPAYCALDEDGIKRMRMLNPKVKLIFIMRDPILRSWSSVIKSRLKHGKMAYPTDEEAIEHGFVEGVRKMSDYVAIIERFERVFPHDQIFYGFFDDLCDRPEIFMRTVFEFLGVKSGDVSSLLAREPINVAAAGRKPSPKFERALAASFLPSVKKLCQRFDGAPHQWQARYEAILNSQSS